MLTHMQMLHFIIVYTVTSLLLFFNTNFLYLKVSLLYLLPSKLTDDYIRK